MQQDLTPPTERIPPHTWARTPKIVRAEMLAMAQELAEAKRRLERAEEQLRRNSQNSSPPPSQDKPGHTPMGEKGAGLKTRRRGGQRDHAGHHRELIPVGDVEAVVVHRPERCAQCGALLLGDDGAPYRFQ